MFNGFVHTHRLCVCPLGRTVLSDDGHVGFRSQLWAKLSVGMISQHLGWSALTLTSNSEENDTARTLNIGFDEPLDELDVPIITALTYTSDQA